jgi:hypothetical protein
LQKFAVFGVNPHAPISQKRILLGGKTEMGNGFVPTEIKGANDDWAPAARSAAWAYMAN